MKFCLQCQQTYPSAQRFCETDGALLSLQDDYHLVGRTLNDKYRIEALIGVGGMGAVYLAHQLGTERPVAFKILLPHLAVNNEQVVELFEREARNAGRLSHPNIINVYDAGRTSDGKGYIAMEWLEGRTLEEIIQASGRLDFERTAEILKQIASALASAHARRIIHRDLKPANVMLVSLPEGGEQVKVLDFGISKVVAEATKVSRAMGTPDYASPEQFHQGAEIDERSDIYSLGVMLYQMLTGTLPFNATSFSQLIQLHLMEPPPLLRKLRADAPVAVEELIRQMLAKDPAERPKSASEIPALFVAALKTATEPTVVTPRAEASAEAEPKAVPTVPAQLAEVSSEEIREAVNQALVKMDANPGGSDNNSRAVFFELNKKYQEKAVPALLEMIAHADSPFRYRVVKLLGYYLRLPSAQKLRGEIIESLSGRLSIEDYGDIQGLILQMLTDAPVARDVKFSYLRKHLKTMRDTDGTKQTLILTLGEMAPPDQRELLAAELVELLAVTNHYWVASYAADVITKFRYRQGIPNLLEALYTSPHARHNARLLRALIASSDAQAKEQLAEQMTDLLVQTMDSEVAQEAATTIREFKYQKACPALTDLLCLTNNRYIASSVAEVLKTFQYRESLPLLRDALVMAPGDVVEVIVGLLVSFQDTEGSQAIQTRLEYDQFSSSGYLIPLGRALYDLQGNTCVEFLVRCFEEGQPSQYTSWIDFFKEKRIREAHNAIQRVRDETLDSSVQQKADEYLREIPA